MRPERDLLQLLADMPFLDRLEMVAISGWSRGASTRTILGAREAGLGHCPPPRHGSGCPTAATPQPRTGLRRLADESTSSLYEPVPLPARPRALAAHLWSGSTSVATLYRSPPLSSTIPIRSLVRPHGPAIALRTGAVAVVREGHRRPSLAKRLGGRDRTGPFLLPHPMRSGRHPPADDGGPRTTSHPGARLRLPGPLPASGGPWSGRLPSRRRGPVHVAGRRVAPGATTEGSRSPGPPGAGHWRFSRRVCGRTSVPLQRALGPCRRWPWIHRGSRALGLRAARPQLLLLWKMPVL